MSGDEEANTVTYQQDKPTIFKEEQITSKIWIEREITECTFYGSE